MKKIKSVDIFGKNCPIKVVSNMDNAYLGLFYYEEFRIEINKNCPKEKYDEILLHELFHAVFNRSSLNQCNITSDAQEIIVDQFAKFITENFKLVKK